MTEPNQSQTGGSLDSEAVRFEEVSRHFGAVRAVDGVSFSIRDGEFFSMLGPSGSGKTTCLRLIAGFEEPNSGHLFVHGKNVTGVPPYDRDVNTVFQDYALFPHMNVLDNVAYGMMIRKIQKTERHKRAAEALEMVKLTGLGDRKPNQLSGGQRQRVALARALVNRPSVLLLDEPLGALDLKLREAMQEELKSLQRQVGITFIYVTHDQGEALAMSDRVAVFNQGKVEQIGTPGEIYDRPRTAFVAGFVGAANLVDADAADRLSGERRAFSLRPERIRILANGETPPTDTIVREGAAIGVTFLGAQTRVRVRMEDGTELSAIRQNEESAGTGLIVPEGSRIRLAWRRDAMIPLEG